MRQSGRIGGVMVVLVGCVWAAAPTADSVRTQQTRYQSERTVAATAQFPAELLTAADAWQQRAQAATTAQRWSEAAQLWRAARWHLPARPLGLPPHVGQVLGTARVRHGEPVTAIQYTPDGTQVVTGGKDGCVQVWDVGNGLLLRTYTGHQAAFLSHQTVPTLVLSLRPDGKQVASACGPAIHLWNLATGKPEATLNGSADIITGLAFTTDGQRLVSCGNDKQVRMWDLANNKEDFSVQLDKSLPTALALSPNGKLVAVIDSDGWLTVWPTRGPLPATKFFLRQRAHQPPGNSVAFSPDGKFIATAGEKAIKLRYAPGLDGQATDTVGIEYRTFVARSTPTEAEAVNCVVFSPDGKFLAGGSKEGGVRVWNIAGDKLVRTFRGHTHEVTSLVFAPDGTQLASASLDQSGRLWDLTLTDAHRALTGHTESVWAVALSPDGQQLASVSGDRTGRIWDSAGTVLHTLTGHTAPLVAVAWAGKVLATAGGDQVIHLWNNGTRQRTLKGHTAAVMALAVTADGTQVLSGSADKKFLLWEVNAGKPTRTWEHGTAVAAIALNAEGTLAATGGANGTLQLWSLNADTPRAVVPAAHTGGIAAVAFSPDGQQLATVGGDRVVKLWTLRADAAPVSYAELRGHASALSAVAFSPDGRFLASAGGDAVVKVWSMQTRNEVRTLRGHADWITSLVFSKDGRQIVTAAVDKTVRVWDYLSDDALTPDGHTRLVNTLAVSPDGKWLVSGGKDRLLKVWNRATGAEAKTLLGHSDEITAVAFTHDNQRIVSAEVGKLKLWEWPSGKELASVETDKTPMKVALLQTSTDGQRIIAWLGHENGEETATLLQTYDARTLKAGPQLLDKDRQYNCVAMPPTCNLVALGGSDGNVRLWQLTDNKPLTDPIPAHAKGLGDVAFTPDAKTLITGDEDGEIKIWNLDQREVLRTFKAHTGYLFGICPNPKGKTFATFAKDGTVKLWNLADGKEVRKWELAVHVRNLFFTPEGTRLFTANADGTIYALELP
jgi:WD40 repeat protein